MEALQMNPLDERQSRSGTEPGRYRACTAFQSRTAERATQLRLWTALRYIPCVSWPSTVMHGLQLP